MKKQIIFIIIIISIIFITYSVWQNKHTPKLEQPKNQPVAVQDDSPRIVSTKPDPLDNNIVSASEPIEITFNKPLQNVPEFKIRIEPRPDYKVELSSDRKTAKIIFNKPLDLGTGFTLYIQPDTKFDEVGEWKQDKTFHFRTIKYTGV